MHIQVRKWENRIAICIPEELAAQAYLEEGMELEIKVVDGKVIISPMIQKYELSQLLAEVTPENLHDEIDTGGAVGCEVWYKSVSYVPDRGDIVWLDFKISR